MHHLSLGFSSTSSFDLAAVSKEEKQEISAKPAAPATTTTTTPLEGAQSDLMTLTGATPDATAFSAPHTQSDPIMAAATPDATATSTPESKASKVLAALSAINSWQSIGSSFKATPTSALDKDERALSNDWVSA